MSMAAIRFCPCRSAAVLEEHIAPFLEFLKQQCYATVTIQQCRVAVTEFSIYLGGRVADPEEITLDHLCGYLGIRAKIFPQLWRRPMLPNYQERLAAALRLFLRFLANQGIRTQIPLREPKNLYAVPGHERTLRDYEHFLVDDRGLAKGTITAYLDHAAKVCRKFMESKSSRWDELSHKLLYEHLRSLARTLGPHSLSFAESALRSFFRFLHITKRCTKNLDLFLIRRRTYVLASVPKRASMDQLKLLFDDVRGNSAEQIRDRAVLLLLTLYGIRIGEVVRLTMEDVRWREQQIILRRRKAGRDLVLPLHSAVAQALLEYIQQVRPPISPYREVFLSSRVLHPYRRGSDLGVTLRARVRKLGLEIHPHMLRHTLASQLINADCPPEWIQQLLGHARFDSTQIYAKVDMAHLREVADNDAMDLT